MIIRIFRDLNKTNIMEKESVIAFFDNAEQQSEEQEQPQKETDGVVEDGQPANEEGVQQQLVLKVKKILPTAALPIRQTEHSAGFDVTLPTDAVLRPRSIQRVGTGICVALSGKDGYYLRLVGRSSTIFTWNCRIIEGVIDADYRGEILLTVENLKRIPRVIPQGTRIAQLIVCSYAAPRVEMVNAVPLTRRGFGGFGSTGASGSSSNKEALDWPAVMPFCTYEKRRRRYNAYEMMTLVKTMLTHRPMLGDDHDGDSDEDDEDCVISSVTLPKRVRIDDSSSH